MILCGILSGCASRPSGDVTIPKDAVIAVYEGLPQPKFEADLLAAERKTRPTVELRGFPFYREPMRFETSDLWRLQAALDHGRAFKRDGVAKACGGFHPDYALEWTQDGAALLCLVYFGCDEVWLIRSGGVTAYEIPRQNMERFKATLAAYRRNRPATASPRPAQLAR